jgi:hypothetical protein
MGNGSRETEPSLGASTEMKVMIGLLAACLLAAYLMDRSGDKLGSRCCCCVTPAVLLIMLSVYLGRRYA